MLKYDTISDDDRATLVNNEQRPAVLDNDDESNAGGFLDEEQSQNYNDNFMPATLPHRYSDGDLQTINLQRHHVEISNRPTDPWNYTYVVFYLLGIATMTPWNFFITAEDVSRKFSIVLL